MENSEKLMAIEEIKQLKARYFRLMDTQDFDAQTEVFCRDIVFDLTEAFGFQPLDGPWQGPRGPIVRGRDQLMAMNREFFKTATSAHHGHCHEITIESPTEARGIVAFEDYVRALDRVTLRFHGAGHYYERYRVEDGAWRIAEIKIERLFLNPIEPLP